MVKILLDLSTWLASLVGVSVLIHLNRPQAWLFLPQKLLSSGLGHYLGIFGFAVGILSIFDGEYITGSLSVASGGLLLYMWYRTIYAPVNISEELTDTSHIEPGLQWKFGLWLPPSPRPRIVKSISIGHGGVGRVVLEGDTWRPSGSVKPNRVGLIYVDIGGWEMRAPDIAVRRTFRYLVGRGHNLLRFRPRVWWQASPGDMVADVFQAILWMKEHAESMNVDPDKIVLIGESAGAHLSLMSAYTAHQDIFCPGAFATDDRTVAGVVAFYPPVDVHRTFEHWGNWNQAGLIFGRSDDVYRRLSPTRYLGDHCPPTLVLHGMHDSVVPLTTSIELVDELQALDVPAGLVRFPYAEHIYDMAAPSINPATRVGLYYIERFIGSL